MKANVKAGKTASEGLTEKQKIAKLVKVYNGLVKEGRIDLKKETTSVSFWVKTIIKSGNKNVNNAIKIRLALKSLPKHDELLQLCITEVLKGFKFYADEDKTTILVEKKKFKKDANGVVIREGDKPVVEETWYERKETFTFNSVYTALFTPSKTVVYVPETDIR